MKEDRNNNLKNFPGNNKNNNNSTNINLYAVNAANNKNFRAKSEEYSDLCGNSDQIYNIENIISDAPECVKSAMDALKNKADEEEMANALRALASYFKTKIKKDQIGTIFCLNNMLQRLASAFKISLSEQDAAEIIRDTDGLSGSCDNPYIYYFCSLECGLQKNPLFRLAKDVDTVEYYEDADEYVFKIKDKEFTVKGDKLFREVKDKNKGTITFVPNLNFFLGIFKRTYSDLDTIKLKATEQELWNLWRLLEPKIKKMPVEIDPIKIIRRTIAEIIATLPCFEEKELWNRTKQPSAGVFYNKNAKIVNVEANLLRTELERREGHSYTPQKLRKALAPLIAQNRWKLVIKGVSYFFWSFRVDAIKKYAGDWNPDKQLEEAKKEIESLPPEPNFGETGTDEETRVDLSDVDIDYGWRA